MPTLPLHTSLQIVRSPRAAVRRPGTTRSSAWWSRVGDWLVAAGERARHHRMGSWTRR
jgi:hypothetical protein